MDATIGHNSNAGSPEAIRHRLIAEYTALTARAEELENSFGRAPEKIEDEATNGKCADLVKLIQSCWKDGEKARKIEKEPFDEGGKAIQSFFKGTILDPLDQAKRALESRMSAYARKRAEEERQRREVEAKAAAEAAEGAIRKAAEDEGNREAATGAAEAIHAAQEAEEAVTAPTADLTRSRGSLGSVASGRTFWNHEIVDPDKIDLNALRPYLNAEVVDQAVGRAVRNGVRQLEGVRIFEDVKVQVR